MRAVHCLIWISLVSLGCAIVFPTENGEESGRVVIGSSTDMNGWQFMASIQEKSSSHDRMGVGLLISPKNTLTTCGCVRSIIDEDEGPGISMTRVVAGTVDVTQMSVGMWRDAADVIMHPHCSDQSIYYQLSGYTFDYAIVQVNISFDFHKPQISRLRLPTWDPLTFEAVILEELLVARTCSVAGWGDTIIKFPTQYDQPSNVLLTTEVQLAGWQECAEHTCSIDEPHCFSAVLLTGKLCANPIGKGNPCKGDIGAPLVCNGFVIAIFSELKSCGEYNEPNYYARLDLALPWISKFTDQHNKATVDRSILNKIFIPGSLIVSGSYYISF